ncbi:MAG: ABC transporter permease [Clostridiales bacterium]|nr:ABC transporter permease [Clostridiales bacterium]
MHKFYEKTKILNRKSNLIIILVIACVYLGGCLVWGITMDESKYASDLTRRCLPPSAQHWFGTDALGKDMFFRCIKGLSISLVIGVLAAGFSSIVALILGSLSAILGGWFDKVINWAVDVCMGLPHIVLLILVSFMLGKGVHGVAFAVAFTHWPSLTRLVRQEVMQVRSSQYVQASYKMGKSHIQVFIKHVIPHVLPVYFIGLTLLFPHAIMHESAVTFLGFGLPIELPAIGVILAESMTHIITGKWWLAVMPGAMLLVAVLLFDAIGECLKKLMNPNTGHE